MFSYLRLSELVKLSYKYCSKMAAIVKILERLGWGADQPAAGSCAGG
jgi:hypothetical protein